MPKLIDIKDADGKALIDNKIIRECICLLTSMVNGGEDHSSTSLTIVKGSLDALEEQSQRQVAVEVDREKLARWVWRLQDGFNTAVSEKEYDEMWERLDQRYREKFLKQADALIAHKEELFKIIYVKD